MNTQRNRLLAGSSAAVAAMAAATIAGAPPRALAGVVRSDASDPKAIFAELKKAHEEYKATVDKQMAGKADAEVNAKVERLDAAIDGFQTALDEINARIAAGPAPTDRVRDQDYTDAWNAHFRKGDVSAALNKGADDEGGYLTPLEWDRSIVDKLVQISPMRQIAQVQQINGVGYKKLVNMRGTGSGWVGETAARPQTDTPEFMPVSFTSGEIYANPAATQQILEDADIDLESWLAGEVETEFAYQEGLAFVAGNGTNKPSGFLTYVTGAANAAAHPLGAIELKTAASATAVTTDELLDLVYLLASEYTQNARWTLNRGTLGRIRKLKDGDGNYIWQPSFQADEPANLLGYPVTEMAAMPNVAADAVPIAFGDFRRGYLITDRRAKVILRDPYTNKPYVHFYTTKRVGGGVQDPTVIKALKMAAA